LPSTISFSPHDIILPDHPTNASAHAVHTHVVENVLTHIGLDKCNCGHNTSMPTRAPTVAATAFPTLSPTPEATNPPKPVFNFSDPSFSVTAFTVADAGVSIVGTRTLAPTSAPTMHPTTQVCCVCSAFK
jgi:hypothetical protein